MPVFCYHKVDNHRNDDWNNITVTEKTFIEQVQCLKNHYQIVPAGDYDPSLSTKQAVITFDDGYEDLFRTVFPLLYQLKVPVTFFISTLRIDAEEEDWPNKLSRLIIQGGRNQASIDFNGQLFPTTSLEQRKNTNKSIFQMLRIMDNTARERGMEAVRKWSGDSGAVPRRRFRMLSSDQIRTLSESPYVTIGAHTVTHPSLGCLSVDDQKVEILSSKLTLEAMIQKPVTLFAYPFGSIQDYSAATVQILQDVGFKKAFSLEKTHHLPAGDFEIPRISVKEWTWTEFLKKTGCPLAS